MLCQSRSDCSPGAALRATLGADGEGRHALGFALVALEWRSWKGFALVALEWRSWKGEQNLFYKAHSVHRLSKSPVSVSNILKRWLIIEGFRSINVCIFRVRKPFVLMN